MPKSFSLKVYYYILALFFIVQTSYSQTHIYTHFGVDDGLPSSEIYDIYQDKQGYIWFATDKGLSRYNGYEFENFTTQDGLPDNTILDFFPQENGQVWFYGYYSQSLFYFNEEFDGFTAFKYNTILKEQLNSSSLIKSIVIDENDTVFIGGYGVCGFIEITKEGDLIKHFDYDISADQLGENQSASIGIHTREKLFFSLCNDYKSTDEVVVLPPENFPTPRMDLAILNREQSIFIGAKLGLVSKSVDIRYYETELKTTGIKRVNDHSFLVGYYNRGAVIRDVSGTILETFLPKKSVTSLLIDREGSYWFSTLDDGIFYIKNPDIKAFSEEHISSLVKDNKNSLYAGLSNGDIANISNNKLNTLYKGSNDHNAIVEFDPINNHLYGYSDANFVNYTTQTSYYVGANKLPEHIGHPLMSSTNNRYYKIINDSIKYFEIDYKIQDICMYNGELLIGTSSGLHIQKDDSVKAYHPIKSLKLRIDDIDLNKETNTVYMATQGAGVIVYGDSIYTINKKHGLTNNIISEIHIENDSTIWACSNAGLNRIAFTSNNRYDVTTITKADGLLSNDIDDIEIINDTVWVATKKGLCYFKKEVLEEKAVSEILSLTLDDVTANSNSIFGYDTKLKHNQNTIDFTLQAISHKNAGNIDYLYRLKEVDTVWKSSKYRNISFPSLSPGKYTFQAKAKVSNSVSNHFINYDFQIQPPFWKSWWFYGICAILFSGLVYLFFKIRVLTYDQAIIRELIRLSIKRLKRKERFYYFRSNGEDFKIPSRTILYVKSEGNYLDISTKDKTYTIRCKIGDFIATTPDALEYLRIHRSYIIRIDQVSSKGRNWVFIKDNKIPVGETYLSELEKIQF